MNDSYDPLRARICGPCASFDSTIDAIDCGSLENDVRRMHDAGGRAFYVMVCNRLYSELAWNEINGLNGFVRRKVKELDTTNTVIVAAPRNCSSAGSGNFSRHAQETGADIISLNVPDRFYSENQIARYYEVVLRG